MYGSVLVSLCGLCLDNSTNNSTTWEAIHAKEQGFTVGMHVALIFTLIPTMARRQIKA